MNQKPPIRIGPIRKPTIVCFFIFAAILAADLSCRYDLKAKCPGFFEKAIPVYGTPAGLDDYDDFESFVACSDQDPAYKDLLIIESCEVVVGSIFGLLLAGDLVAYWYSRTRYAKVIVANSNRVRVSIKDVSKKVLRLLGVERW